MALTVVQNTVTPLIQQSVLGLNEEALEEWKQYRIFKKKPLSQFALDKTIKLLLKLDEAHQQYIVDVAIQNDWQGLHIVDMPKETKPMITGDTSWLG